MYSFLYYYIVCERNIFNIYGRIKMYMLRLDSDLITNCSITNYLMYMYLYKYNIIVTKSMMEKI